MHELWDPSSPDRAWLRLWLHPRMLLAAGRFLVTWLGLVMGYGWNRVLGVPAEVGPGLLDSRTPFRQIRREFWRRRVFGRSARSPTTPDPTARATTKHDNTRSFIGHAFL